MRFVADENISGTVIRLLREAGHDVLSVKETLRGQEDPTILARAQDERRSGARGRSSASVPKRGKLTAGSVKGERPTDRKDSEFMRRLPDGFVRCAATASYQIEGSPLADGAGA